MSRPGFLTLKPSGGEGGGEAGGAATRANVGSFDMTCQEEDFWCWAAVAQAIEDWRGSNVSQTHVASHHVAPHGGMVCQSPLGGGGALDCQQCDPGAGCDSPHYLSSVLDGRSLLAPGGAVNTTASFALIKRRIDRQKPVPVRIEWQDGSGHFVCVSGYAIDANGREFVTVHDPLSPGVGLGQVSAKEMLYDDFAQDYEAPSGSGGLPNYHYEVQ